MTRMTIIPIRMPIIVSTMPAPLCDARFDWRRVVISILSDGRVDLEAVPRRLSGRQPEDGDLHVRAGGGRAGLGDRHGRLVPGDVRAGQALADPCLELHVRNPDAGPTG